MKKKTRAKGLLALALAVIMILGSSLAYFSDRASTSANGTAGTVDIALNPDIQLTDVNGKDILNPGDARKVNFTIPNVGNKSVDIREIIKLTSSVPMTNTETQAEFELYQTSDVEEVTGQGWRPKAGATPLTVRSVSDDKKTITYQIPDVVLDGNHDAALGNYETEPEANGLDTQEERYTLLFRLDSSNAYQNATVTIEKLVDAKQHRNTNADWETFITEQYTFQNGDQLISSPDPSQSNPSSSQEIIYGPTLKQIIDEYTAGESMEATVYGNQEVAAYLTAYPFSNDSKLALAKSKAFCDSVNGDTSVFTENEIQELMTAGMSLVEEYGQQLNALQSWDTLKYNSAPSVAFPSGDYVVGSDFLNDVNEIIDVMCNSVSPSLAEKFRTTVENTDMTTYASYADSLFEDVVESVFLSGPTNVVISDEEPWYYNKYLIASDVSDAEIFITEKDDERQIHIMTSNSTELTNKLKSVFRGNTAIKTVNIKDTSINSDSTIDLSHMFDGCTSLSYICFEPASTWFSAVDNTSYMFNNCSALTKIVTSTGMENVSESTDMFAGCTSLKSDTSNLSYDPTKTDATYANTTTGYFSLATMS